MTPIQNGQCVGLLPPAGSRIMNVRVGVSPSARYAAITRGDEVLLVDLNDGSGRNRFQTGHGQVNGLAFSPSRPQLATVGKDGHLRIWPLR
jgi:hypothetical protein